MDEYPLSLLFLPPELLIQIFDDVYKSWEDVEFPETRRLPIVPLCKALKEIQLEALYKNVKIRVDTRLSQLNKFFRAILARPQLASFVTSLTFTVPKSSRYMIRPWGPPQVSNDSLRKCFRLFHNLQNLRIDTYALEGVPTLSALLSANFLSPNCTSITLTTFFRWSLDNLPSLPVNVKNLDFTFARDRVFMDLGSTPSTGSFAQSLSNLSHLSLRRPEGSFSLATRIISSCSNLASLNLLEIDSQLCLDTICNLLPTPAGIIRLTISALQDNPLSTDVVLRKFLNLNKLTLEGKLSTHSHAFFGAL
ncbi:hypothetical protein JCM3765_006410 [Sporobolomyces pararoseus]